MTLISLANNGWAYLAAPQPPIGGASGCLGKLSIKMKKIGAALMFSLLAVSKLQVVRGWLSCLVIQILGGKVSFVG
jgi:hypothetical protein